MKSFKNSYSAREKMLYNPCGCDGRAGAPPGWLLDKLAEEKLTGGFNTRRSNQCETCFTAKSVNGTCNCI
jgi:hypothetical protein